MRLFQYFLKLCVYSLCLSASIFIAYTLKYNFVIPFEMQEIMWKNILILVPAKIIALLVIGEFKGVFAYFRMPDLLKIVICFSIIATISFGVQLLEYCKYIPSREIILADLLFSILFILFFRASIRIINEHYDKKNHTQNGELPGAINVAIIGANESGSRIASELKLKRFYGLKPIVFLDDNDKYYGRNLHGIPVIGKPELLSELVASHGINGIILADNKICVKRSKEIIGIANELNMKAFTIPSFSDYIRGKVHTTNLRPIDFEDFLERKPIKLDVDKIVDVVKNKVVVVTGAGGSIGSELSRQLAAAKPNKLVLIDHSEYNLFQIEQSLIVEGFSCIPVLLDIKNADEVKKCFEKFQPNIIYHAAAYKHVPLLESQPLVAIKNNAIGTAQLAMLASEYNVDRFILVSTDKAINPVNNMGASKRIAEIFCRAMQLAQGNKTKFMAVRFGNVLGSAGSVLPTFKQQIARGGPVTVTHPSVTRYFMTIPEAVGLILEASSFENIDGKIFVLDMGTPIKILDIAKKMIELNNLQVGTDINIVFTGLRPGEKMHEELEYDPNKMQKTSNEHIWIFEDDKNLPQIDAIKTTLFNKIASNPEATYVIKSLIPDFNNAVYLLND